jgi:hypothetical protein
MKLFIACQFKNRESSDLVEKECWKAIKNGTTELPEELADLFTLVKIDANIYRLDWA